MNVTDIHYRSLLPIALSALLIAGCASKDRAEPAQHSGFLEDYSGMQVERNVDNEPVLRFVSPRLDSGGYQKMLIEPTQFYPEPQPSDQVSAQTLNEILGYIDQSLSRELGKEIELASEPGPGVIRMRVAITALGDEGESLKPHQYIPVALVVTGAKRAATGQPTKAAVALEAELSDSVSGERLFVALRGGTGERLKSIRGADNTVTPESLQPLIDRWVGAVVATLGDIIGNG